MTKEKYERCLKAHDGVAVFACGKQPHDRLWAEHDEAYALANTDGEADLILAEWRTALLRRLVAEGAYA